MSEWEWEKEKGRMSTSQAAMEWVGYIYSWHHQLCFCFSFHSTSALSCFISSKNTSHLLTYSRCSQSILFKIIYSTLFFIFSHFNDNQTRAKHVHQSIAFSCKKKYLPQSVFQRLAFALSPNALCPKKLVPCQVKQRIGSCFCTFFSFAKEKKAPLNDFAYKNEALHFCLSMSFHTLLYYQVDFFTCKREARVAYLFLGDSISGAS